MHTPFFVSKKSYSNQEKTFQIGYPGRVEWMLFEGQRSLLKLFHLVLIEYPCMDKACIYLVF